MCCAAGHGTITNKKALSSGKLTLRRAGKVAGRTIYRPEAVTGSLMQFQMRSKERVLADLQNKLGQLPANHSDRPALIRMIEGLGAEQAQAGVRL